ncbi:MAG: SMP-30/gluconolactonase/LRE family protein [Anaerolineae bacterium]
MAEQFEIFDDRFKALLLPDSKLEKLADGCIWAEGPVELADGSIVWSDIPNNRMLRWSVTEGVSTFRQPSNYTNGNYRDLQGRLITCEHGGRRISRTEADGTVVTVVDNYHGRRLNSPNDLVVKSDGTIWFTDPAYGIMKGTKEGYEAPHELPGHFVYRFDPATNELTTVATDFAMPNGLAFSLDEQRLYIADTSLSHDPFGNHHVRVFDVVDGKRLANGRLFVEINPGIADGFRVDHNGYLYISSRDSIQVYTEDRVQLGKIMVPEPIANCTFAGPQKNRLYITASSSLYVITLNTRGVQKP